MQWTEDAIRNALDGHFYTISHEGRVAVVDTLGGLSSPAAAHTALGIPTRFESCGS